MPTANEQYSKKNLKFKGGEAAQVFYWSGTRYTGSTSGTSARVEMTGNPVAVEITAASDIRIEFGDDAVVADASSHWFLSGMQVVAVPIDPATKAPYTHFAVIQKDAAAEYQVEELE